MISKYRFPALVLLAGFLVLFAVDARAQGTAATYQGRLNVGGAAASGSFDITFTPYTTNIGGSPLITLTNLAVQVTNGLFTTTLDFGGVPNGQRMWLELGVRTNGGGGFTTLSPRQPLSPAPYAMFANTASNFVGSVAAGQISGVLGGSQLPAGIITNGSSGVNLSGTFSGVFNGNGNGLTNIGSNSLTPGAALANLQAGGQYPVPSGGIILSSNASDTNLASAGYFKLTSFNLGGLWSPVSENLLAQYNRRVFAASVWTGNEWLIWGGAVGVDSSGQPIPTDQGLGQRYNSNSNTWSFITALGEPAPRFFPAAVWTGNEMVVYGGYDANNNYFHSGGRYNPVLNSWTPINPYPYSNVEFTTAFLVTNEVVFVGGISSYDYITNNVAVNFTNHVFASRYSLVSNSWSDVVMTNPPGYFRGASLALSNDVLITWGGYSLTNLTNSNSEHSINTGARYSFQSKTWTALPTSGAPSARHDAVSVLAGNELFIWGGLDRTNSFHDGARYNYVSNAWYSVPTNTSIDLQPNSYGGVFTGDRVLIWGLSTQYPGYGDFPGEGWAYFPASNSWARLNTNSAPNADYYQPIIWSGSEMLVSKGLSFPGLGGRYSPATDSWSPLGYKNANVYPAPNTTAILSGSNLIIVNAYGFAAWKFDLVAKVWSRLSDNAILQPRFKPSVIWTGTNILVWGGE